MILSDKTIKERIQKKDIIIDPVDFNDIQPASVDLHLGNKFIIFENHNFGILDVKEKIDNAKTIDVSDTGYFIIHPFEFVLSNTQEFTQIPNDLVGRLEGRSSLGRIGLLIHTTAGYIDPGFGGYITLELLNVSNIPIKIYTGMRIAQLSYHTLTTPAEHPYGTKSSRNANKYHGQIDPTESQIWRDFEKQKKD